MTFTIRAAQSAALAQAFSRATAEHVLETQGYGAQSGRTSQELLVFDGRGTRSCMRFDERGQLAQITSPMGRIHRFDYDSDGRITSVQEPNGLLTTLAYGANGMPTTIRRRGDQQWFLDWDERGNPTRLTLPDGTTCRSNFDSRSQLQETLRGDTPLARFEWNEFGLPSALVEGTGARTTFEYGSRNRPDLITRPDGHVERITRNATGQVVAASIDDEPWFAATYDADRVIALRYADGHFVEFSYNEAGQVVEAKNPDSIVRFTYDVNGRVLSEQQGEALVSYDYDAAGLLLCVRTPTGETLEFDYDADSRLCRVRDWHAQTHDTYRSANETETSHRFPNGVVTRQQLSLDGLPITIESVHEASPTASLSLGYSYTLLDQVETCNDSEMGTRQFRYDAVGRLTGVHGQGTFSNEVYGYDEAGNPTGVLGVGVVCNAANQVVKRGPLSYVYDNRGNLIAETGPMGETRYLYNGQNLLTDVRPSNAAPVIYKYDAFGRRILKEVGGTKTRYLWSGEQLLREVVERGDKIERRDYLFLPGAQTPLSMRVDGVIYQIHTDRNDVPRWTTDPQGKVAWSGVTSGFGHCLANGSVRQPFRFKGQYFDEETGLHYNRARYYSPFLGRYLTRDPMDLLAGTNLYAYANNDPVNRSDPTGLFSWGAAALAVGGIVAGAALVAVCLPAIAVTAAGMLAVAGVVAGAALVGGSVAMLATDIRTDGCMPCMKEAFVQGALTGAQIGFDIALMVLTAGAAGPGLALVEGGMLSMTGRGITGAAIGAIAAAGVLMSKGGGGGGNDGDGGSDDDARRKAEAERKAEKRRERDLERRSKQGDKDATVENNKLKAKKARENGNESSAKGYEAENKVIEAEGDNVVEAGREVKYPDPNNPGKTIASDIDVETKTQVIQVKSGTEMPSPNQTQATRMRAAETGKQPRVVYDPAKMSPEAVEAFKAANSDFITTPMALH